MTGTGPVVPSPAGSQGRPARLAGAGLGLAVGAVVGLAAAPALWHLAGFYLTIGGMQDVERMRAAELFFKEHALAGMSVLYLAVCAFGAWVGRGTPAPPSQPRASVEGPPGSPWTASRGAGGPAVGIIGPVLFGSLGGLGGLAFGLFSGPIIVYVFVVMGVLPESSLSSAEWSSGLGFGALGAWVGDGIGRGPVVQSWLASRKGKAG